MERDILIAVIFLLLFVTACLAASAVVFFALYRSAERRAKESRKATDYLAFLRRAGRIDEGEYLRALGQRIPMQRGPNPPSVGSAHPTSSINSPPVPIARPQRASTPTTPSPSAPPTSSAPPTTPSPSAPSLPAAPEARPATRLSERLLNVFFVIGVLFVLLAGAVFATTTWSYLASFVRVAVVFSISAVFFLAGFLADRLLDLRKTAVTFHVLGSCFLPIAVAAVGYFHLVGSFFAFDGDGRFLIGAACSASAGFALFTGYIRYRHTAYAVMTQIFTTATVVFGSLAFRFRPDITVLFWYVYCALLIFSLTPIATMLAKKKPGRNLNLSWKGFTLAQVSILSAAAMLYAGDGWIAGTAGIAIAFLFLHPHFRTQSVFWGALVSPIFLAVGAWRCIPGGAGEAKLFTSALSLLVFTCFSFLPVFSTAERRRIAVSGASFGTVGFAALLLSFFLADTRNLFFAAALFVTALLFAAALIRLGKNLPLKIAFAFSLFVFYCDLCFSVIDRNVTGGLIFTGLCILSLGIFSLLRSRNIAFSPATRFSDLLFLLGAWIGGLFDYSGISDYPGIISTHSITVLLGSIAALTAALCAVIWQARGPSESSWARGFSFFLPLIFPLTFVPLGWIWTGNGERAMLVLTIALLMAAISEILLLFFADGEKFPYLSYGLRFFFPIVILVSLGFWSDSRDNRLLPMILAGMTAYLIVDCVRSQRSRASRGVSRTLLYFAGYSALAFFLTLFRQSVGQSGSGLFSVFLTAAIPALATPLFIVAQFSGKPLPRVVSDLRRMLSTALTLLLILLYAIYFGNNELGAVPGVSILALTLVSLGLLFLDGRFSTAAFVELSFFVGIGGLLAERQFPENPDVMPIAFAVTAILLGGAGFAFSPSRIIRLPDGKAESEQSIVSRRRFAMDWFTVFAVVASVAAANTSSRYGAFVGLCLLSVLSLSVFFRIPRKYARDIGIVAAMFWGFLAAAVQPFYAWPDFWGVKFRLLLWTAFFLLVMLTTFKDQRKKTSTVFFASLFVDMAVITLETVNKARMSDLILLLVLYGATLVATTAFRKKRWIFLSGISACLLFPALLSVLTTNQAIFFWLLLTAVFCLSPIRPFRNRLATDICITGASAFLVIAFIVQPFVSLPEWVVLKYDIVLVNAFFLVVWRLLFRKARNATGILAFVIACISAAALLSEAIVMHRIWDGVILGIVSLLLLISGALLHGIRWSILGATVCLSLALNVTWGFWTSIAWWIYLLATGILLIVLAASNELARQRGQSLTAKLRESLRRHK